MRRGTAALALWTPPLGLMALIWFLSSQPDLSTGLGGIDLVGRKVVHALEYALLCFLWWRALSTRLSRGGAVGVALALALAYAALDEYHQTGVPGRSGSAVDVAIDAAGAAAAAAVIRRRARGSAGARPGERGVDPGERLVAPDQRH